MGCVLLVLVAGLVAAASGEDSLAEAERLRWTGRYAEALEEYAKLSADDSVVALGVARCYSAVGQTAAAERVLNGAAAKHAHDARLPAALAALSFERGDHAAAQKQVDRALELDGKQLAARWVAAELQRVAGRLDEAQTGYKWLLDFQRATRRIDDAESLHGIGLAMAQDARWNRRSEPFNALVNQLYPAALERNKHYWPARLEAALLFLEKYNAGDALNEINAALAINPNAAEVHAARGLLALHTFDLGTAKTALDRALANNPRLVAAQQLKADLLLAEIRPLDAIGVLAEARLANPAHEETLGRLAAAYGAIEGVAAETLARACRAGAGGRGEKQEDEPRRDNAGVGSSENASLARRVGVGGNDTQTLTPAVARGAREQIIAEAVQRNPRCGSFFAAMGASFDLLRKYPQAAVCYREAAERMPQLMSVPGELGLIYMRLGDEVAGAKELQRAFERDPFNVRVKNTLEVLDVLQGYAVLETDHFVIKFDRGTDELLARYAAKYLEEEAYPEITQRLGYAPAEKSLFEIFSRAKNTSGHGWFSARMVGLPFVGTVGACAGKMVALASPNDMPRKFNWARVLRHEFVHVVNLQQTDFNIPHWFTEALAVLYEDSPRPPAWTQLLARRLRGGALLDLDSINLAFARPKSGDDWTLAYCQAELYAEYMLAAHGPDATAKMLAAYADHLPTSDALRRCFGVEQAEFERGYRSHLEQVVAAVPLSGEPAEADVAKLEQAVAERPQDAAALAALAFAHLQRGENVPARRYADRCRQAEPKNQLAAYVTARLRLSIGETEAAMNTLAEAVDTAAPHESALSLLATLKLSAGDTAAATKLFRVGAEKFPHADKWQKSLARVYLETGDDDALRPTLTTLAELDPDNVTYPNRLAQLARDKQDWPAVAKWGRRVIHGDVTDAAGHGWLAESLAHTERHPAACEEFATALELDGSRNDWRFAWAQSLVQQKQPRQARKVLQELLESEPDFPHAKLLFESLAP